MGAEQKQMDGWCFLCVRRRQKKEIHIVYGEYTLSRQLKMHIFYIIFSCLLKHSY